jgi:uncharacterized protein YbjT (DUF2867 family)
MMTATEPRALVAGATGYLGGFVAREFAERGCCVRALARSPEKLESIRDELDEVVTGEVTQPETLNGICAGIDVVFSSIGITKQKGKLTFKDVDYQGNLNLLREAQKAGVRKFIYVSVYNGPELVHLDIVKAHEDFVAELAASGLDYAVIRPTGYFSDMGEYLKMAKNGRVWLVGSGANRMNPIHGADLAVACVDAMEDTRREIEVGGPETFTYRQIAELALSAADKRFRVSSVPVFAIQLSVAFLKLISRHNGELLAFFATMMTRDMVAPSTGTHSLEEHFHELQAAS